MAFAMRSHREAGMGNGFGRVDIRVTGVAKKAEKIRLEDTEGEGSVCVMRHPSDVIVSHPATTYITQAGSAICQHSLVLLGGSHHSECEDTASRPQPSHPPSPIPPKPRKMLRQEMNLVHEHEK